MGCGQSDVFDPSNTSKEEMPEYIYYAVEEKWDDDENNHITLPDPGSNFVRKVTVTKKITAGLEIPLFSALLGGVTLSASAEKEDTTVKTKTF
jgi:hypothetical protein